MIRPIIEFCASNLGHGTDELMKKLDDNPEYDVVEYSCLDRCSDCSYDPFVLVNGEFLTAASAEELEAAIEAKIKEADAWLELDLD